MSKKRLFVENMLIYGVGGVISKIIPVVMIPVITRLLPNSEYFGLSDLTNTIVSFSSEIAIFGMVDGMTRMFFEEDRETYKKLVCSTAFSFTLLSSFVVFCCLILFRNAISRIFFHSNEYGYLIWIAAFTALFGATNNIISVPTRLQNKRSVFLITNTISPIISYIIAIVLILNGYYVVALPLSALISKFIIEIVFFTLNRKWFRFNIDRKLLCEMLVVAVPAMPSFVVYWIFNSCDKLMISNLLNVSEAGIYSVGSKLGHLSQLIYVAFAGGWNYFAFSTMKDDNQVKSNSLIMEYLGILSVICTIFICIVAEPLYTILFMEEYARGYIVSPYLFLAPLLQMLYQIAGTQFTIIKKTWISTLVLSIGAASNVILNWHLIPCLGSEGAAVATLAGYSITLLISLTILVKMGLVKLSKRFIICFLLGYSVFIIWRIFALHIIFLSIVLFFAYCIIVLFMYKKEFRKLANYIKGAKKCW